MWNWSFNNPVKLVAFYNFAVNDLKIFIDKLSQFFLQLLATSYIMLPLAPIL